MTFAPPRCPNCADAASLIEAQAARIATLEEALRPFTQCPIERATKWNEKNAPWPDDMILVGRDEWEMTVGMIRAARAALGEKP